MHLTEQHHEVLCGIGGKTAVPLACLAAEFGQGVYTVVKKFMAAGIVKAIPYAGKLKLYQLTPSGCALAGVPAARARSLGGQATHHRVAVSFLATIGKYKLIPREKAAELLGTEAPPSVSYVLSTNADGGSIIFLVLTPGPHASVASVVRAIKEKEAKRDKTKFANGEFGYLVAVDTMVRKSSLTRQFKRAALYGKFPLRIEIAPSVNTIQEMIGNGRAAEITN